MSHHVATFWYLDSADPAAPIREGRPSDPGFARRLLSRLFPTATVASLGAFPLNRSASAGPGEIYVGSFPGVTLVQTPIDGPVLPSAADETWLRLVEAPTVLLFSHDPDTGLSGFARWESGRLVRSFAGGDDRIVEDEGMPLPFERPYWAGEFPLDNAAETPLALPFSPTALLHAAHRDWLGFDLDAGGLDVPVHGFATDGRREVRQHRPPEGPAVHVVGSPGRAELHAANLRDAAAASRNDAGHRFSPYEHDDYERLPAAVANRVRGPLRSLGSLAGTVGDAVRKGADTVSRYRENRRR